MSVQWVIQSPSTCVVVALWWVVLVAVTCSAQDSGPQEVEIIKQINRVNEDGSYTYGYEAADGSFKIETRDVMGTVKGMFGFIDETGELKRVSYTANNGTGFKTSSPRVVGVPASYTTVATTEEGSRRPVIQHIPRRQAPTTTASYGEYIKGRRASATTSPQVTEELDEPTQVPLRKLLVTKRPIGKGGNSLRRQLGSDPDAPSSDVADVYSGGGSSPRYVPAQSVRSPQGPLLANLPPQVAVAIRQQQLARAAASLRSTPRPVDEQQFPPPQRGSRSDLLPSRIPLDDAPTQIPFPMASLRSLRDELMDYILQYLQFRLGGGSPYLANPYSTPFQNPIINPNFAFQNPLNYQVYNPNIYNPYGIPGYTRGPFQPPFNPLAYPPVGYPGQTFPQPLPFSSPNKQQATVPSQRSVPSTTYEQQETRGSSDDNTYTLPPAEVLRMVLARGLQTSTIAPVRNVQILGSASSVSSTTVRPPAPVDEMEMQA